MEEFDLVAEIQVIDDLSGERADLAPRLDPEPMDGENGCCGRIEAVRECVGWRKRVAFREGRSYMFHYETVLSYCRAQRHWRRPGSFGAALHLWGVSCGGTLGLLQAVVGRTRTTPGNSYVFYGLGLVPD